ncbi:Protein FAM210B, mitochondrial [Frankliniella fusca]|uniref:Protein FAM210B, mitochondrial n=1 Tax=Frankliniella fusca TaxID=407009 RepID=A0AAE1LDE4_9NEOP|nr:Protein FAM210B, mitochondrial [Frankliniella fusca]
MALRFGHFLLKQRSVNLNILLRSSHVGLKNLEKLSPPKKSVQDIHLTSSSSYPDAKDIPLPSNVEDINAIETGRFSPQRARDITGDVIVTHSATVTPVTKQDLSADSFVESYDCSGTVSLNSAMQTNVPDPYISKGKSSHLNMPGGEWGRSDKYVAQDLQNSHYTNIKENDLGSHAAGTSPCGKKGTYSNLKTLDPFFQLRHFSSAAENSKNSEESNNKKSKIVKAIKDYGPTVIVFHVTISLISLGGFYLAVTSGIDVRSIFAFKDFSSELAGEVGAFVIAYAVHKMFAPVRISMTLFCTPFIVRYLRKVGILTKP